MANAGSGTLSLIDASTLTLTNTLDVGGQLADVVVDEGHDLLAVSRRDRNEVVLIDRATLAVRRTLAVGAHPMGLALVAGGGSLLIACAGDGILLRIDLATFAESRIAIERHTGRVVAGPGPDGAYLLNDFTGRLARVRLDEGRVVATVTGPGDASWLSVASDGRPVAASFRRGDVFEMSQDATSVLRHLVRVHLPRAQ